MLALLIARFLIESKTWPSKIKQSLPVQLTMFSFMHDVMENEIRIAIRLV